MQQTHVTYIILLCDFICREHISSSTKKTIVTITQKSTKIEIFLRNVHQMYSTLPPEIQSAIDRFTNRLDSEESITKMIETIRKLNLDYDVEEDVLKNNDITLINRKSASNVNSPVKHTISMEDKLEEFTNVIKKVHRLILS